MTKTWLNYTKTEGEIFTEASKTVPDQTLTVRELLVRHTRGLPLDGYREPIYDEDETSQGLRIESLDLVDKQVLMASAKETQEKAKNDYKKRITQKQNEQTQPEGH